MTASTLAQLSARIQRLNDGADALLAQSISDPAKRAAALEATAKKTRERKDQAARQLHRGHPFHS